MHARRRGKAGSKKPLLAPAPGWIQYKTEEIEALVAKFGKQGLQSSQIGLILRDSYGVPDIEKITGKKIGKILDEKKLTPRIPEDLQNLVKQAIKLKKHMELHRKDMTAKRGLQLIQAKINRLAKYYKRNDKLPEDWKLETEVVG
jgi:small subunit ribosomal protein S15